MSVDKNFKLTRHVSVYLMTSFENVIL